MAVPNPFVDPDTGDSLADEGQHVNGGKGGTAMAVNPATTKGVPVNSASPMASLDIISFG